MSTTKPAPDPQLRNTVCRALVNYPSHQARVIAKMQGFEMYYMMYDNVTIHPPQQLRKDPWNIFVHVNTDHIVTEAV